MDVAFVAQTESCSYLLDADGICRWVIPSANANENARQVAKRCVGAQYVASLDAKEAGLLVHDPKPGRALVFARIDDRGRVSLLRSGTLLEFTAVDAPAEEEPKAAAASEPQVEAKPAKERAVERASEPAAAAAADSQPATVQYPEGHRVPPPVESDEDITIEGIRAVKQAELDAGIPIDEASDEGYDGYEDEEDNGETSPFLRGRVSSPTLRGVAPPANPVVRRRGVLPRRNYAS